MKQQKSTLKQFINSIKRTALFVLLTFACVSGFAQTYTWIKGASVYGQSGTYGSLGIPSMNNTPGGRETATNWTDASGNFWVFGGFGIDNSGSFGFLNDLWKYTVSTNQWTWISGSNTADQNGVYGTMGAPSALNIPGSRQGAVSWVDGSGNLWLFGGTGFDNGSSIGELNDVWKYNVTTNQWTWIKGANVAFTNGTYGTQGTASNANTPGARSFAISWKDNTGNFWLMGGNGYDGTGNFGDLNDLWKYNPTSNQWTWMKGANGVDNNGSYGTLGIASAGNNPGSRYLAAHFTDLSGNLWLSGGAGYDGSNGFEDLLNDVWKYNPTTNQWTWMGGSNLNGQNGVYGTLGVPSALNMPGGRLLSASMRDAAGNFYLLGGVGYDLSGSVDVLNDLWKYNVTTNQWTWIAGSDIAGQSGVYGTQGVPAAPNTPGGRSGVLGFTDATDNLWVFGGFGMDENSSGQGELNDLWRLTCLTSPTVTIASSNSVVCLGSSFTFTASGAGTFSWSTGQTGPVVTTTPAAAGQYTIGASVTDANGCSDVTGLSLNVFGVPGIYATTNKDVICKGEQAVLSGHNGVSYLWNTTPAAGNASVNVSPTVTTTYTVKGTDANGCSKTFAITQTVNLCTGIAGHKPNEMSYNTYPNPSHGSFIISGPVFGAGVTLFIYNTLGQKMFETNLNTEATQVQTQLEKGIYHYGIMVNDQKVNAGKLIIE